MTEDDLRLTDTLLVWSHVQVRWARRHGLDAGEALPGHWLEGDRRDAALMLFFMSLGWGVTNSKAYLYLRLQMAFDDPASWKTVLVKNLDGGYSEVQ